MNIYKDLKTINDLLKFIKIHTVEDAPYLFLPVDKKKILEDIKISGGYKPDTPLKEIVYRETICKEKYCPRCNKETKYNKITKELRTFCSSKCATIFNKMMMRDRRMITMENNFKDEIWLAEYKNKLSVSGLAWNKTDDGILFNKNKSERMINDIKSGVFTPNITNSWTKWTAEYNGKKFRSLFEAIFYGYVSENIDKDIKFEKIRIEYKYQNKRRIYIVDFHSEKFKTLFEIKPKSLKETELNLLKTKVGQDWAESNGYKYTIISENKLKDMVMKLKNKEFIQMFYKKYPKWK